MPDTRPAIVLAKGSHPGDPGANAERCLFEWYNWLTRHQHTDDRPPGVSPVLHRFGMSLNDALPDDTRQQLVRYLPNGVDRLGGTEGDGKDEVRGYLALDWLVRAYLPAWLDLAGLAGESSALRGLAPVRHMEAASAAGPVVRAASAKANAAWDAAWAAAGDAAGDAAWDAARAAAWAAAWAAARAAAWDAARAAAWAAAWAAAGDAAGAAAWAAARDAAGAKLASTVALLQADAILLYDRMIAGVFDA
jgi:hypothetical protein